MSADIDNLLNKSILNKLKGDVGNDAFGMILNAFLDELDRRCEEFPALIKSGDLKTLEIESHALKSAAKSFGADVVSALCLEIETKSREADTNGLMEIVEKMISVGRKTHTALTDIIS